MAIGEIKEYNGKKYISVKEHGCTGCAFYMPVDGGYADCSAYASDMDSICYYDQSVWKEYEVNNKYTVEEVIDCLVNVEWLAHSDRERAIDVVNRRIKLMTDPDYKKFLELKEKFKDIEK